MGAVWVCEDTQLLTGQALNNEMIASTTRTTPNQGTLTTHNRAAAGLNQWG
jgi:hypothetical protein